MMPLQRDPFIRLVCRYEYKCIYKRKDRCLLAENEERFYCPYLYRARRF